MNTKEFARLCNVEKRTLFYYDELGLLKPESVRENGYRNYSDSQLERMDIIKLYQACGCSLSEIQAHVDLPVAERWVHLHRSMNSLKARIDELQEVYDYLREKEALYLESQFFKFQIQELSFRFDRKALGINDHFFSYTSDHFYTAIQILRGVPDSMYIFRESQDGAFETNGKFAIFYLNADSQTQTLLDEIDAVLTEKGCHSSELYIKLVTHLLSENGKSLMKVYCKV